MYTSIVMFVGIVFFGIVIIIFCCITPFPLFQAILITSSILFLKVDKNGWLIFIVMTYKGR